MNHLYHPSADRNGTSRKVSTDPRVRRFADAYRAMARQAKYRPQAPSDGFGNIQLSATELEDPERLDREAEAYSRRFAAEEDDGSFRVGCSNFPTNRAFVWIIEAARLLASGTSGNEYAYELLNMAMPEIVGATHPWRDAVRSPDDDETEIGRASCRERV